MSVGADPGSGHLLRRENKSFLERSIEPEHDAAADPGREDRVLVTTEFDPELEINWLPVPSQAGLRSRRAAKWPHRHPVSTTEFPKREVTKVPARRRKKKPNKNPDRMGEPVIVKSLKITKTRYP